MMKGVLPLLLLLLVNLAGANQDTGEHPKLYYAPEEANGYDDRFIVVMKDHLNATQETINLKNRANDEDLQVGHIFQRSMNGFVVNIQGNNGENNNGEERTRLQRRQGIYKKLFAWLNSSEVDWIEQVSREKHALRMEKPFSFLNRKS